MPMAAAKTSSKNLAVYVIGISGSMNYTGCGKSSLCRQFVYDHYMEESCSTLLQSEFDSAVVNRRHAVYWGQKEKTYLTESSKLISVNYEIFEHTVFYEDGTNLPYSGHENYEKRVFTPLKHYANAYAFKSRDEVLNPEDYGNKRFIYSKNIPVAYLYVMDVSQPFSVFEEQLVLMNKLVKLVQKKHCCVLVASKFDIHSQGSIESLESHANNLKLPVVHCSAKFGTNINAALRTLGIKALSLKKVLPDEPSRFKVPPRRPLSIIFGRKDNSKKTISVSDKSAMKSKTLPSKVKNSFENASAVEFSKRSQSFIGNASKFVNFTDHSTTLPSANYQNIFDFKTNSSEFKHGTIKTASNNDFSSSPKAYEEIDSKGTSSKIDEEMYSDCKPATTYTEEINPDVPSPPLCNASVNGCVQLSIQESSETPDRPLLLSPILVEAAISNESKEKGFDKLDRSTTPTFLDAVTPDDSNIQQNSFTLNRSTIPLPSAPLDALTSNDSKEKNFQHSSEKLDRSTMPLPPIPICITSIESTEKSSHLLDTSTTPILVGNALSNELKKMSFDILDRLTMPLPPIPLDTVTSNQSKEKNFDKLDRSTPTPVDTISSNESKEKSSDNFARPAMPLPPIQSFTSTESTKKSSNKLDRSTTPTPLSAITSKEKSFEHNSCKLNRSMPLLPTSLDTEKSFDKLDGSTTLIPLDATTSNELKEKSFEQSPCKLDRSAMPLPPTPLDAVTSKEKSFEQNSCKLDRSTMPLPPIPLDAFTSESTESNKKSSDKLDRSTMPLPPIPLDAFTSESTESNKKSSDKLDRSTMPLPPIPLDAFTSTESNKKSSDKLDRSTMPLPPIPLDAFTSTESNKKSSDKLNRSTMPLPPTPFTSKEKSFDKLDRSTIPAPLDATNFNELKEKSFEQSSCKLDRSTMPLPPTPLDAVTSNDSKEKSLQSSPDKPNMPVSMTINERLLPVASEETAVCLNNDYVISDYEFYSMQKLQQTSDGFKIPVYLELQSLDTDLGNYVIMHKIKDRKLKIPSYAYDYVYHPYIQMFKRKLRQNGVPPRRVKREGYTPLASVDTSSIEMHVSYVNIKRLKDTTLFLPPRGIDIPGVPTVSPEEHSHLEAVVLPRNLPRNGCYLSAPSAVPL